MVDIAEDPFMNSMQGVRQQDLRLHITVRREREPYIQTWPYYRLTPKGFARREKVAQSTPRK